MKKRWQEARRAAGLPADKPNIVVSHVAQVCWQKVRQGTLVPRPPAVGVAAAAAGLSPAGGHGCSARCDCMRAPLLRLTQRDAVLCVLGCGAALRGCHGGLPGCGGEDCLCLDSASGRKFPAAGQDSSRRGCGARTVRQAAGICKRVGRLHMLTLFCSAGPREDARPHRRKHDRYEGAGGLLARIHAEPYRLAC